MKKLTICILKIILFILSIKYLFIIIYTGFIVLIAKLYNIYKNIFINTYEISPTDSLSHFIDYVIYPSIFCTIYLFGKVFGIFKLLDKIKVFFPFTIIAVVISTFLLIIGMLINTETKMNNLIDIGIITIIITYIPIPPYWLYKFFKFLAKRFPIPFGVIGYYTSIEPWKKLWQKLRTHS